MDQKPVCCNALISGKVHAGYNGAGPKNSRLAASQAAPGTGDNPTRACNRPHNVNSSLISNYSETVRFIILLIVG